MSAFLGLPFAEEMLAYYEDQPLVRRPGTTSNLPPTPGLRDWRTQLSQRQLETFERIAAETLAAFGYPLSGTS